MNCPICFKVNAKPITSSAVRQGGLMRVYHCTRDSCRFKFTTREQVERIMVSGAVQKRSAEVEAFSAEKLSAALERAFLTANKHTNGKLVGAPLQAAVIRGALLVVLAELADAPAKVLFSKQIHYAVIRYLAPEYPEVALRYLNNSAYSSDDITPLHAYLR